MKSSKILKVISKCSSIINQFGLSLSKVALIIPFLGSGSVTVSWDANQEKDLAGYMVYYGKTSQNYTNSIWVPNQTSYIISGLEAEEHYYFAVTAVDFTANESSFSGEVSAIIPNNGAGDPGEPPEEESVGAPGSLVYNFPNPFKVNQENTAIRYEMVQPGKVTIEILDVNMKLVKTLLKNDDKSAGEHTEDIWDGTNSDGDFVANGVYFCSIKTEGKRKVIKIAVIR